MDKKIVPGKVCYLPTGVNMQHVGDGIVMMILWYKKSPPLLVEGGRSNVS